MWTKQFKRHPQNHLQGVKSRQSQGEAFLCKTAKESTQRLYLKPKTVSSYRDKDTCLPRKKNDLLTPCSFWQLSQVRVNAVPNGETKQRAVVVFGSSMKEVCVLWFFNPFYTSTTLTGCVSPLAVCLRRWFRDLRPRPENQANHSQNWTKHVKIIRTTAFQLRNVIYCLIGHMGTF